MSQLTLQQLRCVRQVVDSGFSVSRAADALHTTQPGVSKMIRSLEEEIGAVVFVRAGNRLTGLTPAGKEALALCCRVLEDAASLKQLGSMESGSDAGELRIGTTHFHARYALIGSTQRFLQRYPRVKLQFTVGSPAFVLEQLRRGAIDIGLCSLPEAVPKGILSFKAYEIDRCLIVPVRHPLLKQHRVTIQDVGRWPLITYDAGYTSGSVVEREFQRCGVIPQIVMRATDATVIKAYVAAGIGIAVIQKRAFSAKEDRELRAIAVSDLFPSSNAMFNIRGDHLLKPYAFEFMQLVAPQCSRAVLEKQLIS